MQHQQHDWFMTTLVNCVKTKKYTFAERSEATYCIYIYLNARWSPKARRPIAVHIHNLSGHVNLNKFLWNIKKVKSPLCECEQEDETPDHVVSSCQEFKDKRENIDNPENTVAGMILKNKDSPESWRRLCVFISYIAEVKQK